jgi:UDP-glucose 4-epimerase
MRILITGGAGFIGSSIATALAKKKHKLVIYDIHAQDTKIDNIEHVKGDIFDAPHLTNVLKECASVIHLVGSSEARTPQKRPQMSFDLNIRSLQVLLEAMRDGGVPKLILSSSSAVYGIVDQSPVSEKTTPKPTNIYGSHKYIAEQLAEAYSLNYNMHITILRLFNVCGIGGHGILNILLEKASKGESVKLYGEKQKRDFIHVSDVADAFANILQLDREFAIYNVGTGVGRSIEDIANLVKERFPSLSVEHSECKDILYDFVADLTKIRDATSFDPDRSDDKLRGVVRNWRSYIK